MLVGGVAATAVVGGGIAAGAAVPAVAVVVKPLLTKKGVKLVVCGALSLCGKEKGGEIAEDFERVEKVATKVLEKLRKAETKIEPPKPKIKLPSEPKPIPKVEPKPTLDTQ